jgi:hypothetical protein
MADFAFSSANISKLLAKKTNEKYKKNANNRE